MALTASPPPPPPQQLPPPLSKPALPLVSPGSTTELWALPDAPSGAPSVAVPPLLPPPPPAAAPPASFPRPAIMAGPPSRVLSLHSSERIKAIGCPEAERKPGPDGALHSYYTIAVATTRRRFVAERRFGELRRVCAQLGALFPSRFAAPAPVGSSRACYCMPSGAGDDDGAGGEEGEGDDRAGPLPLVNVDLSSRILDEKPRSSRGMEARRRAVGAFLAQAAREPSLSSLVLTFLTGRDDLLVVEGVGDAAAAAAAVVGGKGNAGGRHAHAAAVPPPVEAISTTPLHTAPVSPYPPRRPQAGSLEYMYGGGAADRGADRGGDGASTTTAYSADGMPSGSSHDSSSAIDAELRLYEAEHNMDLSVASSTPAAITPAPMPSASASVGVTAGAWGGGMERGGAIPPSSLLSSLRGDYDRPTKPLLPHRARLLPPPWINAAPPDSPWRALSDGVYSGEAGGGSPSHPHHGHGPSSFSANAGGVGRGGGDAAVSSGATSSSSSASPSVRSSGNGAASAVSGSGGSVGGVLVGTACCEAGDPLPFTIDDMDAFDFLLEHGFAVTYGDVSTDVLDMLTPSSGASGRALEAPAAPSAVSKSTSDAGAAAGPRLGQRLSASWLCLVWDGGSSTATATAWVKAANFNLGDEREERVPIGLHAALLSVDPTRATAPSPSPLISAAAVPGGGSGVGSLTPPLPLFLFTAIIEPSMAYGETGLASMGECVRARAGECSSFFE